MVPPRVLLENNNSDLFKDMTYWENMQHINLRRLLTLHHCCRVCWQLQTHPQRTWWCWAVERQKWQGVHYSKTLQGGFGWHVQVWLQQTPCYRNSLSLIQVAYTFICSLTHYMSWSGTIGHFITTFDELSIVQLTVSPFLRDCKRRVVTYLGVLWRSAVITAQKLHLFSLTNVTCSMG